MLFGDLMTAVQFKLPIKVVVFNNGKLGFIDIEQKSEGLLPLYTHLQNPDFGAVAKAMGLWGRTVAKVDELEAAIGEWLAYPGPALLDAAGDRVWTSLWDGPLFRAGNARRTSPRSDRDDQGKHLTEACEQYLHDRIPNRCASCDHPLDQSCGDTSRDPL
jgi:hypothetical protein